MLQFIENPTEEMCWEAIKSRKDAAVFIDNPTEEMCWEVAKYGKDYLCFISDCDMQDKMEIKLDKLNSMNYKNIESLTWDDLKTLGI